MYDRLPLNIIDTENDPLICKGKCFLFGQKNEQVTALLLAETSTEYVLAYPSKCYYGVNEEDEEVHTIIPYTTLPVLSINKDTTSLAVPLHSDLEQHYYEYLTECIVDHEDFIKLLVDHDFCPDKSRYYYLDRHSKVKKYCDKVSDEMDGSSPSVQGEILH